MAPRLRSDALIALALAALLGAVWTLRDWSNLARLRLPDTDDVMRLAQVRDWLAGQAFGDLHQYRLDGGLPMHWTRLADCGPAALIVALRPWLGTHAAEVAAVTVWPILLFAAALLLVMRIARHLGGERIAATAGIVAALAYPATTIFLPGRIDHHGLQTVLLLGAILGLLAGGARQAAAAGLCAGASLIVGLETAPLLAVLGGWLTLRWTGSATQGDEPLAAFAVGAFAALMAGRILFAGSGFAYPACDGFTQLAWQAALTLLVAPILLSGIGTLLVGGRARAIAALAVCGGVAALALARSPQCLSPYGAVDPRLARLWLRQVGEAQSVLSAPLATTLGYAGLSIAGWAAALWQWLRTPGRGWDLVVLLLGAALAVTAMQLRGAYPAALLAVPGLAGAIAAARARGGVVLAGSWLASAGMLYPLAADALAPPPSAATPAAGIGDCASPALLAALAQLPRGRVIAPVDAGAWIVGGTQAAVLAAPYHRDGRGILAVYAFYAAPAAGAAARADRLGARYVLACAGLPGATDRASTAAALGLGALPGFAVVAQTADGARIMARKRLSRAAPAA